MTPQFIDKKRYPVVFSTDRLLAQGELRFSRRRFEKGSCVFREQERHPFTYHMVSGLVRLHLTSPDGGVKTLFYHTDGTQFGFQGFKRDGLTKSTAVAVADTELLEIRFSDLLAYCDVHTECYLAYLEYLFSIMSSQTDEIASLSFETGLHRLAGLLRSMALGGNAEIPYSIDELAEMVGAHRNTVSNALAHLRGLGLVSAQTRPIAVADVEGLSRYVDGL